MDTPPHYLVIGVWGVIHKGSASNDYGHEDLRYQEIIFFHKFAKAFFGEEAVRWEGNGPWYGAKFVGPAWKWHLSQMVLEPEPLKYLEKFL
jgi:hypothetical protein